MVQLRFSILALLIIMGCANRGNPTGGEIDTEPPIVIKSSPENFTTNFEAEEIEIIFNEYIRLNNIQKELIISPPIEPQPLICLLYTSPSPRDSNLSRMPSSA